MDTNRMARTVARLPRHEVREFLRAVDLVERLLSCRRREVATRRPTNTFPHS